MADTFNILDTPAASGGIFSESFESAEQTITAAGQLVLAHGLSDTPKLIQAYLKCTIANSGYSVGDLIPVNNNINTASTLDKGISIVPDSTNLTIRIGANAESFQIIRKDTGAFNNIVNTSYRLIFKAYA